MSLLLYHNQDQKVIAEKKRTEWEHILNGDIQTEIASCSIFYLAEDYHQKYYLKRFKNAIEKLNTFFPNHTDFVNSTLTARLNGLAKGYGSPSEIRKEINDWGLNTENKKELIELLNQIRW
jgi:peptide-methionine (S)-S-oxide reductase